MWAGGVDVFVPGRPATYIKGLPFARFVSFKGKRNFFLSEKLRLRLYLVLDYQSREERWWTREDGFNGKS